MNKLSWDTLAYFGIDRFFRLPAIQTIRDTPFSSNEGKRNILGDKARRLLKYHPDFETAIDIMVDDIRLLSPLESSMERQKTMRAK